MATIGLEPNGRRRILFVAGDGSRKTVRLGQCSKHDAEEIRGHIAALAVAKINGQPVRRETAIWLKGVSQKLYDRLSRAGLVEPRTGATCARLGPSLTAYLKSRADLKPSSLTVYQQVIEDLKKHFGENRDARTITPGQADDFKQWMIGRKLASTTIHKRLQVVRTFFNTLRRRRLIEENPFEDVKMAASGIRERQRFISREDITRVLGACPNHDWRCIVVLARYGGLRCPSEVLSLRWQDINWETGRITVTSPKTERYADGASRVIPLFPELRDELFEAFEAAPEGAEYVVDERFRKAALGPAGWGSCNLRTTFKKIIHRAGVTEWPKLFHNLRASRETELVENFPVQVVTQWLGNTPTIAMRHYLMTTDDHFDAAVGVNGGAKKAAQIPAQQPPEMVRNASHVKSVRTQKPAICGPLREGAAHSVAASARRMEARGLEPLAFSMPSRRSTN